MQDKTTKSLTVAAEVASCELCVFCCFSSAVEREACLLTSLTLSARSGYLIITVMQVIFSCVQNLSQWTMTHSVWENTWAPVSGEQYRKNSPDRELRSSPHLDPESHIVVNVSSTSNIIPSFIKIRRDSITRRKFKNPAQEIKDILV